MDIQLIERTKTNAILMKKHTKFEDISSCIGATLAEIGTYLAQENVKPSYAPFVAYYNMDVQNMELGIGFPISGEVAAKGEMVVEELHSGRAVCGIHKGSYKNLCQTYDELSKFIQDNKLKPINICYEYYLNAPGEVPEEEQLTEVVMYVQD